MYASSSRLTCVLISRARRQSCVCVLQCECVSLAQTVVVDVVGSCYRRLLIREESACCHMDLSLSLSLSHSLTHSILFSLSLSLSLIVSLSLALLRVEICCNTHTHTHSHSHSHSHSHTHTHSQWWRGGREAANNGKEAKTQTKR